MDVCLCMHAECIRPPRGLGGAPAPPWATAAAAAVGPGGGWGDGGGRGGDKLGWGHIRILYKAPTDDTKPQNTIQSPDRLYKAPTNYIKPPKRLYKDIKH